MQSLSTSPSRAQKDDSDGKKEKKAMAVNAVLGVFFFFPLLLQMGASRSKTTPLKYILKNKLGQV